MPLQQFLTSGQPDGTDATNANTGGTLVKTGGTIVWKNDAATGRTKIVLTSSSGTAINARFALADATQHKMQATVKITTPAVAVTGQVRLLTLRHSSGNKATLTWESDGRAQFLATDSLNPVVIPAGTLALNTEYVFAITIDDAGTATLRIFNVGGATPIWSKMDISGQNYLPAQPFTHVDIGGNTPNSILGGMDLQTNTGAGSEIPDYVPSTPLADPTVTKGATVLPTVVGGSDGKQTISFTSVPNASRYDAYIAGTLTPAANGSDWVLVQSNVTSPFQFTGLDAGNYSWGIQAMP